MKRKMWSCILVAGAILLGIQAGTAEEMQSPSIAVGDAVVQTIREKQAEDEKTYAPRITVLENGVRIQRTPNTDDSSPNPYLYEKLSYNMKFLEADRRGCQACHLDLMDVVNNMDSYPHLPLEMCIDVQYSVDQCMSCQDHGSSLSDFMAFGNLMHMTHGSSNKAFAAMGGDCWSCHYSSGAYTEMQLWDHVKHDVLRGITTMDAEMVQQNTTFEWEQDTVVPYEQMFPVNWYSRVGGVARYAAGMSEAENMLIPNPDEDGLYDQWTVAVGGEVDRPFTMTINEMIDTFGLKNDKMTIQCGINVIGGAWIGNYEITGISIKDIMEYAGAHEGVNLVTQLGMDGSTADARIKDIEENDGYLVLAIDGKPIPYHAGYPIQLWAGGELAWSNNKEICGIDFVTVDPDDPNYPHWEFTAGNADHEGVSYCKPNIGLIGFKEGQIIEAGKPYTFEGYAAAWDTPITSVEYSFDRGETWMTCPTPDANVKNWVYWHLTWNAPEAGAYTMMIRSNAADGSVTVKPLDFLVNVQ